ncbi:hypothetical protein ACRAWD_31465 [Caulobacter segnis]
MLGDPALAVTDVGPVIDAEAKDALDKHQARLVKEAKVLHALAAPAGGTFSPPSWPRSRPPTSWSARCSAPCCTWSATSRKPWSRSPVPWRPAATA